jgi:hypothetical protein
MALADTGLDVTTITNQFVPGLGVDLGPPEAIAGIGGQEVRVRCGDIELELRRGRTIFRWKARVAFSSVPLNYLGQQGFFDLFIVSFNSHRRELTIKPNPIAQANATVLVSHMP